MVMSRSPSSALSKSPFSLSDHVHVHGAHKARQDEKRGDEETKIKIKKKS
jgi:hypothetical protein